MNPSCEDASGGGGGGGVCDLPVYPRAVTSSLRQQIKSIQLDDTAKVDQATGKLQLPSTMDARTLNDATIIELEFDADGGRVHEVDVLRGREMVKQYCTSKGYGSVCLVVRRPG
jgi:hypothetical protein